MSLPPVYIIMSEYLALIIIFLFALILFQCIGFIIKIQAVIVKYRAERTATVQGQGSVTSYVRSAIPGGKSVLKSIYRKKGFSHWLESC